MTREEAINMLHGIQADNLNLDDSYTKDKYDALTMAIKELEQEHCEGCISRQAVKEACQDREMFGAYTFLGIDDLPSVTPQEPKTGCDSCDYKEWLKGEIEPKTKCSCEQIKWERDTAIAQLKELGYGLGEKPKTGHWTERRIHEPTGFFLPVCSECGAIQPYAHHTFSWNYCPNCGARMESEG